MSNQDIIAMLHEDLKGEHMAIVQYLRHAYAMGEGEMACEIEAIARDEMRHFDWLSELVVALGGKPTIERAKLYGVVENVADNMRFDVQAEEDAIALYRQHIEAIDDPKIQRLLSRILSDEEAHRADFLHFVEKAEQQAKAVAAERTTPAPSPKPPPRMAEILNEGVRHEYTVILQYLYHRFLMPDCEVGNELEMQTINEMQHLGWLSEELEGLGGTPDIEHTKLELEGTPEEMLKADIKAEREVTAAYTRQIPEIEEPGLKELIARIRDHEIYHDQVFSDLLEEVERGEESQEASSQPKSGESGRRGPPAVGSLLGQEQK